MIDNGGLSASEGAALSSELAPASVLKVSCRTRRLINARSLVKGTLSLMGGHLAALDEGAVGAAELALNEDGSTAALMRFDEASLEVVLASTLDATSVALWRGGPEAKINFSALGARGECKTELTRIARCIGRDPRGYT